VYELEGTGLLRTRLEVARTRGFSKFVGRAEELAGLEATLERILQGEGRVVGVVGEAGVGKSRLCFEFLERCRVRGIRVLEGHCPAHGKSVPFLPALELFRAYFGIEDQDSAEEARRKIAGTLILLDEAFHETLPLVFDFLGVSDPTRPVPRMDPEARQRQLFAFLRRLVEARSEQEPAITFLDDIHWIDGGTDALLAELVEVAPRTRTLVLVNFRPEYHADWMSRSIYRQLPLLPLGRAAIEELLVDLLGGDPSLAALPERIQERTRGNPFFIEEVVQSLVENGSLEGTRGAYRLVAPLEEIEIPGSVQTVLAARIDRLAEGEKQVLQTASVIGKEFREPILQRVAELPDVERAGSLAKLVQGEFLFEQTLYPETEYAFKHPLTQEVAYRSQLSERRARTHAAVARAIEEVDAEKLDESAALLAHHWEEAGDALQAARWHSRAAEWAATSQLAEALRHWRKVRTLLENIPASAETMALGVTARIQMLNLGWRLGASEDEATAIFAEGKALAERSGDLRWRARLALMYCSVRGLGGDLETWLNSGMEAARLADQTDDAGLKAACRVPQITAHFFAGRLSEALLSTEEALAQTPDDPTLGADILGFSPHIFALCWRGATATAMGRHDEAEANLDRAVELARQQGEAEILGWAHTYYVWLARSTGRPGAALGHARRAVEIAERIGSPLSRVLAYGSLGEAHLLTEEWGEAAGVLDRALEIARETRAALLEEATLLVRLAEAYLGLGEDSRARATADEALAVARRRGTKLYECDAHLTRARVLLRTEGATASGDIQSALRQAQALVEETGGRSREPFIHVERANLARLTGDEATRERELREAHRLFTEMGASGHAERVAKELGR
jgi:adenylate cyclase